MSGERVKRRLAAILAADVAGYSRLIGEDEAGTLSRLRGLRRDPIDPSIASHNGRVVKTTGDGLFVESSSTVDALRCACQIQARVLESNWALRRTVASNCTSAFIKATSLPTVLSKT